MSKRSLFPILLWALVCVVGYVVFVARKPVEPNEIPVMLVEEGGVQNTPDGRAISVVPWGHLPGVDRFVLTDHEGQEFDSATLHGTPYVVSFFFSSCPTFCRDLNKQLRQSNDAVADANVRFLTITVDPDVDTVKVLKKYADGFDAKVDRWSFLTGSKKDLVAVGQGSFNVVVDRDTHTDDILLVDKWGRYRDRFKWNSAEDMKRFVKVVKDVAAETEPPLGVAVQTRNIMAGVDPPKLSAFAWLRDFHLEGAEADQKIFSRRFSGQVWLARFVNGDDGTVENHIKEALIDFSQGDSKPIPLLRISESKPEPTPTDSEPEPARVTSVSGWASPAKLKRVSEEYFGVPYEQSSLVKQVFVMDRWGNVRDVLSVDAGDFKATLRAAMREYAAEQKPGPPSFGTWPR